MVFRLSSRLFVVGLLVGALGGASCTPAPVAFECDEAAPMCDILAILADERPLASGVSISRIYLYQAVEIPIMVVGASSPEAQAPIVADRDAMFRIFVQPLAGYVTRTLTARVLLYKDGRLVGAGQDDMEVGVGKSDAADMNSTFNVHIPGYSITEGVRLSVQVVEASADVEGVGASGQASWPDTEPEALDVVSTGGGFRIYLLPVEYDADGSGRVPDVSAEALDGYRSFVESMYPIPGLELEVGEPFPTDIAVGASDMGGWSAMLGAVSEARAERGLDDDQYIYGMFQPTDTFGQFCGGGCVAGLSSLSSGAGDAYTRASTGLGYADYGSWTTMAHEVGHAAGRNHSPGCGAAGADPSYPDAQGFLDVRGYDRVNDVLMEKATTYDIMSYCQPYWMSAFTYSGIYQRTAAINALYYPDAGDTGEAWGTDLALFEPATWHAVRILADGSLLWGSDHVVYGDPGGEDRPLDLLDAAGGFLQTVQARYTPVVADGTLDPMPPAGGVLQFRAQPWPGFAKVRFGGRLSPPLR
jgi:hypothetical protein